VALVVLAVAGRGPVLQAQTTLVALHLLLGKAMLAALDEALQTLSFALAVVAAVRVLLAARPHLATAVMAVAVLGMPLRQAVLPLTLVAVAVGVIHRLEAAVLVAAVLDR
jgi:hypothetical protein